MPARRSLPDERHDGVFMFVQDARAGGDGLDFADFPTVLTGAGAAEWARLGGVFEDQPMRFREGDRGVLIAYCLAWSVYMTASAQLAEDGLIVEGRSSQDRGRVVKNPLMVAWTQAGNQVRYLARELGLTPDSRGRMGIKGDSGEEEPNDNPFGG